MSLATIHTEDRRGIVLSAMMEDPNGQLNERSIRTVLRHYGHAIDAALVRELIEWLKQAGLVRVSPIDGGDVWLAQPDRGRPRRGRRPAPRGRAAVRA